MPKTEASVQAELRGDSELAAADPQFAGEADTGGEENVTVAACSGATAEPAAAASTTLTH